MAYSDQAARSGHGWALRDALVELHSLRDQAGAPHGDGIVA